MKEANAGMQNEILTILLKECKINNKILSYSLRSPFDKLLASQPSDWKNIIINNIKDLEAIEYNIKALDLVERK
jgi:ribosomal protein L32E